MPAEEGNHSIAFSLVGNALLVIGKGVTGILANSNALIADALHSMTDVTVFFMNYSACNRSKLYAGAEQTRSSEGDQHNSDEIELRATYYSGLLLLTCGLAICIHNSMILVLDKIEKPDPITAVVAYIVLAVYIWLHKRPQHTNTEHEESCVLSKRNAMWQNKMNVVSGSVVAIGLTGSMFGFIFMDDLAAVAVGSILVAMGIRLSTEAGTHLDTKMSRYLAPLVLGSILTSIAISAVSLWITLS